MGAPWCSKTRCSIATGSLYIRYTFYYTWTVYCLLHLLLHQKISATTGNTAYVLNMYTTPTIQNKICARGTQFSHLFEKLYISNAGTITEQQR